MSTDKLLSDSTIFIAQRTAVDQALAAKADTSMVITALTEKADLLVVNQALADKVSTNTLVTSLANKANTSDLTTVLQNVAAKADQSAMTVALAGKIPDAPKDGHNYVRFNGSWVIAPVSSGSGSNTNATGEWSATGSDPSNNVTG